MDNKSIKQEEKDKKKNEFNYAGYIYGPKLTTNIKWSGLKK